MSTSLVARPMALGSARVVLCGRWGLCGSCRNTVLYPKSVHIVQLRLVWLDIWCENSLVDRSHADLWMGCRLGTRMLAATLAKA